MRLLCCHGRTAASPASASFQDGCIRRPAVRIPGHFSMSISNGVKRAHHGGVGHRRRLLHAQHPGRMLDAVHRRRRRHRRRRQVRHGNLAAVAEAVRHQPRHACGGQRRSCRQGNGKVEGFAHACERAKYWSHHLVARVLRPGPHDRAVLVWPLTWSVPPIAGCTVSVPCRLSK